MVRPFGIKGKKRKKREERYDREGEEEEQIESVKRVAVEKAMDAEDNGVKVEEEGQAGEHVLEGIPIAPSDQKTNKPDVVFVLERACLEVAKIGKIYQILNSEDHANFLRKNKKNPADYRPDIIHQALLSILDSPVNKAGRLRAVYVRTQKGVLFEVKPHVRIPRTYKRFAGIMLQLLQKLSITAVGKREKLLRVIKNPVTQYLPLNSRRIGLSFSSEKLVKMKDYVKAIGDDMNLVFVVGAMAHGKVETDYTDDFIAISGYPLSAARCIARICEAVEDKWNIL
ncbi:hypothetical protein SLA2020_146630 [Shorea laevis]